MRKAELSKGLKSKIEFVARIKGKGNEAHSIKNSFVEAKRSLGDRPGTIIKVQTIVKKIYETRGK